MGTSLHCLCPSPLGLMYWAAVGVNSAHRFQIPPPPFPQWNHFLKLWLAVLLGWLEHPNPSLPQTETQPMIHALEALSQGECLTEIHNQELCTYYKRIIARSSQAGGKIIFRDGSFATCTFTGQVGRCGVLFGRP